MRPQGCQSWLVEWQIDFFEFDRRCSLGKARDLSESRQQDQATAVRLNSRRKARKPVMPIPKRAIEVGSGTPVVAVMLTVTEPPVPVLFVSDASENVIGGAVPVWYEKVKVPDADGANEASISFDVNGLPTSESVMPGGKGLRAWRVIGLTLGVYVISTSCAVPPITLYDTVVVTVVDPAWLGVANATLASKPAAATKKTDRFVIENS